MQAHGAVDLMRHDDLLPWDHVVWCSGHHQRASAIGKVRMRGEEGFDLASARNTESGDAHPPAPAARHSKREIGQCPDAGRPQGRDDPRCKPAIDAIADQRDWNGSSAQQLEGGRHRARRTWTLAGGPGEVIGKIVSMAGPGEGRDASTDRPDDAARGLAGQPGFAQVPRDCLSRRQTLVPGPQC